MSEAYGVPKHLTKQKLYDDNVCLFDRVAELEAQLAQAVKERDELSGRYADLMSRCKGLMKFYDDHAGTPYEQIRHAQEVEDLTQERDRLAGLEVQQLQADLVQVRQELEESRELARIVGQLQLENATLRQRVAELEART
jgi:hypothetical protein